MKRIPAGYVTGLGRFGKPVRILVTNHAIRRSALRFKFEGRPAAIAAQIGDEITGGSVVGFSQTRGWQQGLRELSKGNQGHIFESENGQHLYLLKWDHGDLIVVTAITPRMTAPV